MSVYKLQSSRFNLVEQSEFVGDEQRLFYTTDPFKLYISDGQTPGGTEIPLGASLDYVDARIEELIDGAPVLLDTLNELAAAIGDDENFAVTITNELANKLDINDFETQFDINLATINTDEVNEGSTNLYYTDARVKTELESGDIDKIVFDTTYGNGAEVPGTLSWSQKDGTLNIYHPGGPVQQVGQEQYAHVRNNTGVTIPDGTVVQFAGAEIDGEARLEVMPFLADGAYPSLYTLGITTQSIADGDDGRVTVWGKVRDLNTTGTPYGETWSIGQVLYASPTVTGGFTNVKPTAPNNVVPVAAVLRVDATVGEIFVRPTIEQRYDYGTVSSTQTQTLATINTPTAVTFDTIQNYIGVSVVSNSQVTFAQSGLYTLNFNIQALSSSSSAKQVYFWLRKNGVDVPYTTRIKTLTGNGVYNTLHVAYNASLGVNEYVELMWASDDTTVTLVSAPATAFAPSSPSAYLHIDQSAL